MKKDKDMHHYGHQMYTYENKDSSRIFVDDWQYIFIRLDTETKLWEGLSNQWTSIGLGQNHAFPGISKCRVKIKSQFYLCKNLFVGAHIFSRWWW